MKDKDHVDASTGNNSLTVGCVCNGNRKRIDKVRGFLFIQDWRQTATALL